MDKFTALLLFVLSLLGIDTGASTFVHRVSSGGIDTLYSKAVVEAGVARFECVASASGRCYYTVYPRDCSPPVAPRARRERCLSQPVERFAVDDGDSRQIAGLPDFRLCVSADASAVAPDCRGPQVARR